MDTVKYSIFLKVLECRSFSKAANELGYTQSAVSHSVSSLEKSFGFKLLNRDNNDIRLTRAGIDVLPYIRNVVSAQNILDFTLASYNEFESGTLCIATIPSLAIQYFPDLLREFNEQYPKIHIVVIDGNYEEVEEMLAGGRVDFGFSSVSTELPFKTFPLFREALRAIIPCGHPLVLKESVSLHDLESETFIMPGEGPNHQIGQLIRKYQLNLNIGYSVSDDNLTVSMVSRNVGVSILPEMSFKNYLNFPFVVKPITEGAYRDIKIIYNDLNSISPISRTFIMFVQNYFKKLLSDDS
ncbi:LysR family transcriptional regulator [Ruminococcus sp. CLA-AA-H200]|uniref:LysR family transcriptional regulator n=1 Tax=Ruminococcus turbiniformis TaxID=2881258 RepID=A0ABS8FYA5_9FIRM|nr:LysR family transcriptional regulator [Ruminococcus turbiniformis]MCC2255030.1 LysR family transcriptional regulator [Ruminococcus turbiniformis]